MDPRGDRALTVWERDIAERIKRMEGLVRGVPSSVNLPEAESRFVSSIGEFGTNLLNEMKDMQKQMELAAKLVPCPLSFSLMPVDLGNLEQEEHEIDMEVQRVTRKVPRRLVEMLITKLKEQFGSSNEQLAYNLMQNIWLQVLYSWLLDHTGSSDENMRKIKPKDQLSLMAAFDPGEEDLLKVLVRRFELSDSRVAEDVITELVLKMALALAELAPNEDVARGSRPNEPVSNINLPELD